LCLHLASLRLQLHLVVSLRSSHGGMLSSHIDLWIHPHLWHSIANWLPKLRLIKARRKDAIGEEILGIVVGRPDTTQMVGWSW
jgi:hypothetical protein